MTESPIDKYLHVFPSATREHARSIMESGPAPRANTFNTVHLALTDLPQTLHPGHPGYHWLSLIADSGIPASAEISMLPPAPYSPERLEVATWACLFTVSAEDPDVTQERTDSLLQLCLRAGLGISLFTTSAQYVHPLVTDANCLRKATLNDAHRAQMATSGASLLPDVETEKRVKTFTVGDLAVTVQRTATPSLPRSIRDRVRSALGTGNGDTTPVSP